MKKTISMLFATTLLFAFTAACDSEETTPEDRAAELQAGEAPADVDAPCDGEGPHGKGMHGKFGNPGERLCAELECSEEQAQQITALFAAHRPDFDKHDKGDREAFEAARTEANQKLADAFRSDSFDATVLDQLRPPRPEGEDADARLDEMVDMVGELHALLTPAQRETLAGKIAEGGPMFLHGPGGKHGGKRHGEGKRGKHGERDQLAGPEGERSPEAHLAKKVDRFCEPISCSDEQKTQLQAVLAGAREDHQERRADKPDFAPFADLVRADTLDKAKLRELMVAGHAKGEERGQGMADVIAEVHDILTPAQRATVADSIAEGGLRAVMGHGEGKRGGKHGK
ncbi:MAG: Spy/CpxP family protein refolding chaperone, partial [Myxococcales bacterium]|nr:Spy/CpxP family protein refolding chaperone [Myxococcales bacterium]